MNRRTFSLGCVLALAGLKEARALGLRAIAGDRFLIESQEARLADILAPRMKNLRGAPEPFAEYSKTVLERLLFSNDFVLEDAAPADRWARRIVHARNSTGNNDSLQERLVAAGAARVRPETDDEALISSLLDAEAEARREQRGLWQASSYAVWPAQAAEDAVGRFGLVEGTVKETYAGRGRFYLNFGEDFRKDFTVTAPSRLARRWAKDGFDLESLAGARVRARGHVAWINGPSIELTHRQAIEVLDISRT